MSGCRGEAPAGVWGSAPKLTPQREANKRANNPQGYEASGINALQTLWNKLRAPLVLLAQGGALLIQSTNGLYQPKRKDFAENPPAGGVTPPIRSEACAKAQTSFRICFTRFTDCAKTRIKGVGQTHENRAEPLPCRENLTNQAKTHTENFSSAWRFIHPGATALPYGIAEPVETCLTIRYTVFRNDGFSTVVASESEGIQ